MTAAPKRRGRPPLPPGHAATERIELLATPSQRAWWERSAGDVPLGEWIRDRLERGRVAKIVVSPDDGDWHWVAYDAKGRASSCAGLPGTTRNVKHAARKAAEEHGLTGCHDADVEIERP